MNASEIISVAVSLGISCNVNSWLDLKKIVLISIPPKDRSLFSTRDPKTKKQSLNKLEHAIISEYQEKTGIKLKVLK
jgi:hypothetical protein